MDLVRGQGRDRLWNFPTGWGRDPSDALSCPGSMARGGIASQFRFFHAYALFGGILVALSVADAVWLSFQPPALCGPPGVPTDCALGDVFVPGCGLILGGVFLVLGLFGAAVEDGRVTGHRPGK
jgi:hypothetical protein